MFDDTTVIETFSRRRSDPDDALSVAVRALPIRTLVRLVEEVRRRADRHASSADGEAAPPSNMRITASRSASG